MSTKTCSTCAKTKPLTDFAFDVKSKDYRKVCLQCSMYKKKHCKTVNYVETSKLQRHSKAGIL